MPPRTVSVWIAVRLCCRSCSTDSSYCVVAKPIDLLARYISAEDDDLAIEMHEPYTYLNVSKLRYWDCAHSMWSRFYATVGRPFVHLSVYTSATVGLRL